MITIESDRTAAALQTIASEILGEQVSVTQAGRLGNEITIGDLDPIRLALLRGALRGDTYHVYVTRR